MTRNELHNLVTTHNDNKLLLEVATGFGKTLAAILFIEKNLGLWNIVVAETAHITTWRNEFIKHGKQYLLDNVKIFCYASLHKHLDGNNYVFDEVHHVFSIKRLALLKKINLSKVIALSATVNNFQKAKLTEAIGNYTTIKVTLSEAIDEGVLPEPMVYFVGVNLDDNWANCKYEFGKTKHIMLTEKDWYDKQSNYVASLKEDFFNSYDPNVKLRWLMAANKRKKFLATTKTRYARILLQRLTNKRLILFAGSIPQAESLMPKFTIHSKNSKEVNDSRFNDFINKKSDKIAAVGKLKEGVNLPELDCAVIVQLDNSVRYYTQILGRSLRSTNPVCYILYVKNTRDVEFTSNVLEGFNMDYVKFVELKDILV